MIDNKIFYFNKIKIFFKHTDYFGFVHPYNYLEWTSYVREAFFSEKCGNFKEVLDSNIKMMTAEISSIAHEESAFGDEIEAQFTCNKIKKVSFDVHIKFINHRINRLVCETFHTLVFVDAASEKFTLIPEGIRNAIIEYQEP